MAGNVSGLHVFQADTGPEPLSLLDTNYSALANAINSLLNFSNYYVDSGTAGNLVVTVPAPQSFSYADGMILQVKVAATNTGTGALINVNALGNRSIINTDGSLIQKGQLVLGAIITIIFSSSVGGFLLTGGSAPVFTTVAIANQVAFGSSRITSNQSLPASTITDLIFNSVNFQQNGTNYSNSTGIFTAPSPGIYLFTSSIILTFAGGANSSINLVYFSKNNTTGLSGTATVQFLEGPSPITQASGTSYVAEGSAMLQLALGDTVRVKVDVAAGAGGTTVLNQTAQFSGYLLG